MAATVGTNLIVLILMTTIRSANTATTTVPVTNVATEIQVGRIRRRTEVLTHCHLPRASMVSIIRIVTETRVITRRNTATTIVIVVTMSVAAKIVAMTAIMKITTDLPQRHVVTGAAALTVETCIGIRIRSSQAAAAVAITAVEILL
jgi:hypothetical protein